ncbi:MAG: sugar ABC transporter permease [Propionibacteriales bacterium]|nr:sugar ABC transporter permease [Propionibacteriales bacterium]
MQHGKYPFIVSFLVLPLTLYAIFVISPFVQAFHYSLTDWSGVAPEFDYVGLQNFQQLMNDSLFLRSLRNNAVFLFGLPLVTVLLALFFAFLLNVGGSSGKAGVKGIRGNGFYKLAFFLPQVLSVPVIAVIWSVIMDPTSSGLANSVLGWAGLGPSGWLADPNLALWCVLWVLVWGSVGFYLVLFNAAMSSIPRDIFEAAVLDGAGRFSTFVRVTMPLLWDTIQTSWVYLAILALDVYALVAVMTAGPGGPNNSTQVISLQIAQNGFQFGRAGYASAMGVVLFFFTLIIATVMLRITRRERIEY